MTALLLLAATVDSPPADWSALPPYPAGQAVVADGSGYVRREVEAAHCSLPPSDGAEVRLALPVAVLVAGTGQVRRITPRAIGCPTVEQYTVGYVQSLTRGGTGAAAPGWYRLTVAYRW